MQRSHYILATFSSYLGLKKKSTERPKRRQSEKSAKIVVHI